MANEESTIWNSSAINSSKIIDSDKYEKNSNDQFRNISPTHTRSSSSGSIQTSSSYFSLISISTDENNASNTKHTSNDSSSSTCDTCSISPSDSYIGYFNYHPYQDMFLKEYEQYVDRQNHKPTFFDADPMTQTINESTKTEFDDFIYEIFDRVFLIAEFDNLPETWNLVNFLIQGSNHENFSSQVTEKYITSKCLSKYLCLLQQLMQSSESNDSDENQVRLRIGNFCKKLIFKSPEIVSMFIQQLARISKIGSLLYASKSESNRYFANVIKTNLSYSDTNQIQIPIAEPEVKNIVEWLYPDWNLPELFRLIQDVGSVFNKQIQDIFGTRCRSKQNYVDQMMEKFFKRPRLSDPCSMPVLENLFTFLFQQVGDDIDHHQTSPVLNVDNSNGSMTVKSLLVFCLRATIFEQTLETFKNWSKDRHESSDETNYINICDFPMRSPNRIHSTGSDLDKDNFNLISPYLVGQLYQLTIDLVLLVSTFNKDTNENSSQPQQSLIHQLLRLRLADLDFETYLKRAMDSIDLELNVIYKSLQDQFSLIDDNFASALNVTDELMDPTSDIQMEIGESDHNENQQIQKNQIPQTLLQKRQLLEKIKVLGNHLVAPVNNKWAYGECCICLEAQWLLFRNCCQSGSCLQCLTHYYTDRVRMGQLSIECLGPDCKELVFRAEVLARLASEEKALYGRLLLMQSNESERIKPCPRCNKLLNLSSIQQSKMKQAHKKIILKRLLIFGLNQSLIKQSKSFKVQCQACQYDWCFKCHSPWHEGISCKDYVKGDTLLKWWAKHSDKFTGDVNAQKCPKCKIYIQRISGCDHMHCTRCKTDFCYRCGDHIRHLRFLGDHYSRLSILGCKYTYKPESPFQRKLVRGAVLGSKLMILPVLTTVCLCTGALVLAVGVAAMPFIGGIYFYNRLRSQRERSFPHIYQLGDGIIEDRLSQSLYHQNDASMAMPQFRSAFSFQELQSMMNQNEELPSSPNLNHPYYLYPATGFNYDDDDGDHLAARMIYLDDLVKEPK